MDYDTIARIAKRKAEELIPASEESFGSSIRGLMFATIAEVFGEAALSTRSTGQEGE